MLFGDVEYFDGWWWRPLCKYRGEDVLVYSKGRTEMVKPREFRVNKTDVKKVYRIDEHGMRVTSGSSLLVWDKDENLKETSIEEISDTLEKDKIGWKAIQIFNTPIFKGRFPLDSKTAILSMQAAYLQDSSLMTEYNYIDKGIILLSDTVYSLNEKARLLMFRCIGLSMANVRNILLGDYLEILEELPRRLLENLVGISQVTLEGYLVNSQSGFLYDGEYLFKSDFKVYETTDTAYWLETPTGHLVVRYKGKIYVVGNIGRR